MSFNGDEDGTSTWRSGEGVGAGEVDTGAGVDELSAERLSLSA